MLPQSGDPQARDRRRDLPRADAWLFGPMLIAIVALPFAIVTMLSVSLWFLARNGNLAVTEPMTSPSAIARIWHTAPQPPRQGDGQS